MPLTKRSSDLEPGTRGDDALDGVAASHRLDYGCPSKLLVGLRLLAHAQVVACPHIKENVRDPPQGLRERLSPEAGIQRCACQSPPSLPLLRHFIPKWRSNDCGCREFHRRQLAVAQGNEQSLDDKDRGRARVALAEGVYLPDARDEPSHMAGDVVTDGGVNS